VDLSVGKLRHQAKCEAANGRSGDKRDENKQAAASLEVVTSGMRTNRQQRKLLNCTVRSTVSNRTDSDELSVNLHDDARPGRLISGAGPYQLPGTRRMLPVRRQRLT
jgi:hypothetical protein